MIEIKNVCVEGWEAAIRGMRNPLESWELGDSELCESSYGWKDCHAAPVICPREISNDWNDRLFCVGANDLNLMKRLSAAGTDHSKFMRMINVTCDIIAPLYWWKEFDTYKVGTVANSCSTMHKIHAKEFKLDDFSCEHLDEFSIGCIKHILDRLNGNRRAFIETEDKTYWWQMIQLLPSSYNQRRTVQLNYAVLKNMYHARKNHKLDEWIKFCDWIEQLPYADELLQTRLNNGQIV